MGTGTTTATKPRTRPKPGGGTNGNGHHGEHPFDPPGGGPGGDPRQEGEEFNPAKYRIGIWVVLVGVLMLFMALSSAYYIRMTKGLVSDDAYDWKPLYLPPVLWITSSVLLLSSITIEVARRKLRGGQFKGFNRWVTATAVLGTLFLAGQLVGWRQLANQGVYLSSNAHSSFFYVLTCLHGLHLLGGLLSLSYVALKGYKLDFGPRLDGAVYASSVYWHFMGGLWIYLFVLLFFLG